MKKGTLLGLLGCTIWMLNIATSSKAHWINWAVGICAVALLIAGTILTGVQKQRPRLGIGLSLLSVVFGIGFLIMLLVPDRKLPAIA